MPLQQRDGLGLCVRARSCASVRGTASAQHRNTGALPCARCRAPPWTTPRGSTGSTRRRAGCAADRRRPPYRSTPPSSCSVRAGTRAGPRAPRSRSAHSEVPPACTRSRQGGCKDLRHVRGRSLLRRPRTALPARPVPADPGHAAHGAAGLHPRRLLASLWVRRRARRPPLPSRNARSSLARCDAGHATDGGSKEHGAAGAAVLAAAGVATASVDYDLCPDGTNGRALAARGRGSTR